MIVSLLLACQEPTSDRLVVPMASGAADDSGGWSNLGGATDDTGATSAGIEEEMSQDCGVVEPVVGSDVLALDYCVRLSPEGKVEIDTSTATDTGVPRGSSPPPPPCGVFNMVGAVAIGAGTDFAYCDSDIEGGMRFVSYDASSHVASHRLLAGKSCYAAPTSGDILRRSKDQLAFWLGEPIEGPASDQLEIVVTTHDLDGTLTAGPDAVGIDFAATSVAVAGGTSTWLVGAETAGLARSVELDDAGHAIGSARELGTWQNFDVGADGSAVWIAACDKVGLGLLIGTLDAEGTLSAQAIPDAACWYGLQPSVAVGTTGTAAVAWTDQDGASHLTVRDGSNAPAAQIDLEDAIAAAVTALDDGGFLYADGGGNIVRTDSLGGEVGRWRHPKLVGALGTHVAMRMKHERDGTGRDVATILFEGMDALFIGPHVYTYDYLELSAFTVP